MGIHFSPPESRALYGLLADSPTDIVLKTDDKGFIVHASGAIQQLGLPLSDMLIGPHLLDLVDPSHVEIVRVQFEAALRGSQDGTWLEFPASGPGSDPQWFEIRTRPLARPDGRIYGSLSVMRSIERTKSLEQQLFAAELTDGLTGLTNRKAFIAMLQHLVDERIGGCLALFAIDHLTAINLRFGHSTGDRALVAFSDLLRTLMRRDDIVSRVGSRCLGVLLPGIGTDDARDLCQRVIDTLGEIRREGHPGTITISASAGVARIENSVDDTINRAEFALFLAQAKGRDRLEMQDRTQLAWKKAGKYGDRGAGQFELPPHADPTP